MNSKNTNNSFGPLLSKAIEQTIYEKRSLLLELSGIDNNANANTQLPVILKLATVKPKEKEVWSNYKERILDHLGPVEKMLNQELGLKGRELITANSIQVTPTIEQIRYLAKHPRIEKIELDPKLQILNMDDVEEDLNLSDYRQRNPYSDGSGVSVAVLDSGIDLKHPFLRVTNSRSTCEESDQIPGSHGTHCAGSIASRDNIYRGIAPSVNLLNVKVLNAAGSGTHTSVVEGVDAALDFQAEVLSMSLGFNHFPTWAPGGHGWMCTNGHCPLCTAIDNASLLNNVIAVVAAGNSHQNAEYMRNNGYGNAFDTELGCPGNAREAITVGAITKRTYNIAPFSSYGPTSYGLNKPDLCAQGVNIISTIPVPRDQNGMPMPNAQRAELFGRKSGTSMATPIVAGAVALIIQKLKRNGQQVTSHAVKNILYNNCVTPMAGVGNNIGGRGRLFLDNL